MQHLGKTLPEENRQVKHPDSNQIDIVLALYVRKNSQEHRDKTLHADLCGQQDDSKRLAKEKERKTCSESDREKIHRALQIKEPQS